MGNDPGSGRRGDDDLSADGPAFSDEGMRRIIYGQDRETRRDSRSSAFAQDTEELAADLRGRRSLVPVVTALAALLSFGAIVWYAYSWGTGQMANEDLPVVSAQPIPEKVKPDQPGGMDVPHQGIAVLNEGESGGETPPVERLLPPPETPAPPEPLEPALAQLTEPGAEESIPQAPEAPLIAEAPPADAVPSSELAQSDAVSDAASGAVVPIPKPGEGEGQDQIAALLEQEPLETANGEPSQPPSAPTQSAALATGAVVLQLSSVKSEAAAGQEWARLQKAHPDQLGGRALALDSAEVKGTTYYRVQTGPFPSRAAAADLCAQLKSRNQDCLVKQR
ncbi:MAG: SPOR domain-containing protein [Kiloniellaceae bacterium]